MNHRPKKRFGQNFLQSSLIINQIMRVFNPQFDENVVEIGPGQGALTKPLLNHLRQLKAIEIDRSLHEGLVQLPNAETNLTLISGDALAIDYAQFGEHLRLIGNLPYNISTPLIIHLLKFTAQIEDMHFMLQKEVVERLVASPGCKDFGRLTVMVQYYCHAEHLIDVPPDVFHPKPKVDSAVVRITPRRLSPYPFVCFADLERVVAQAFSMRRKILANNLKPIINAETLLKIGIDPGLRPEQLCVADYAQIAKFIPK